MVAKHVTEPLTVPKSQPGREVVMVKGRPRVLVHAKEVTLRGAGLSPTGKVVRTKFKRSSLGQNDLTEEMTAEERAVKLLQR